MLFCCFYAGMAGKCFSKISYFFVLCKQSVFYAEKIAETDGFK
jgi:hypothetical protein